MAGQGGAISGTGRSPGLLPRSLAVVFGAAFLVAAGIALAASDLGPHPVALACGLSLTAATLALGAVDLRYPQGMLSRLPAAVTALAAVAFLRHAAGGAGSALSPLLLAPLFWVALRGTLAELGVVAAGVVVVLGVPIISYGDPAYPLSEWYRVAVWALVAPVAGAVTQRLVHEVVSANEALALLARTDPLTGLPNRRAHDEFVTTELLRARRGGTQLALALLDLDRFKQYNDTRGHRAGDDLLVEAAAAWRRQLRATDQLARWGGEEFVIVLPDCSDDDLAIVLERVRAATPGGQTCSVGTAVWDRSEDADTLLSRADQALYRAKEHGRDRVVAG